MFNGLHAYIVGGFKYVEVEFVRFFRKMKENKLLCLCRGIFNALVPQ